MPGSHRKAFRLAVDWTIHLEPCPEYANYLPFGLCLQALGHYLVYVWGYGSKMIHGGVPSFFGLGLQDGHVPTF